MTASLSRGRIADGFVGITALLALITLLVLPIFYLQTNSTSDEHLVRAIDLVNRADYLAGVLRQSGMQPTLYVWQFLLNGVVYLALGLGAALVVWQPEYSWIFARLTLVGGIFTLCSLAVVGLQFSILHWLDIPFAFYWGYVLLCGLGMIWIGQAWLPREIYWRQSVQPQPLPLYQQLQQTARPPLITGAHPLLPLPQYPTLPVIPAAHPPNPAYPPPPPNYVPPVDYAQMPPPAYGIPLQAPSVTPIGQLRHLQNGQLFKLYPPQVRIGRGQGNEIVLPEKSISRQHGLLQFDPQQQRWILCNISEQNLVLVNQQPLPRNAWCPLNPHDRIQLGEVFLEFIL